MTTALRVSQRGGCGHGSRQFTRVINESVKYASLQGVGSYSVQKGPTDALFSATLTLQNVVVGSRYRVTRASNGAELATGVAASPTVELTIPVYEANMQADIRVRNASGSPVYKPFETAATMTENGGSAYILQQID
jgi:hypothetical protein